jgi:hypothetical protein
MRSRIMPTTASLLTSHQLRSRRLLARRPGKKKHRSGCHDDRIPLNKIVCQVQIILGLGIISALPLAWCRLRVSGVTKRTASLSAAALLAVFTFTLQIAVRADTFGSGANTFTIDFVRIGNAGNAADTTGDGAVPYDYRVSVYEVPQDAIVKATASGMSNVTAGAWTGSQPAASISWYAAAAFVNWLSDSTGRQRPYDLSWDGFWNMNLWSSTEAWQLGGENRFRHKDAFYFLPSEDEWYKAAYYNHVGSNYFVYPIGGDAIPAPVASGTSAGTAVYDLGFLLEPAPANTAGGASAYGTSGQGGNVWEMLETSFDEANGDPTTSRVVRGGAWRSPAANLSSLNRAFEFLPFYENEDVGFRVASIPEPSTHALLLITGSGVLWWARRRR